MYAVVFRTAGNPVWFLTLMHDLRPTPSLWKNGEIFAYTHAPHKA
jgi:hypothetical protein